MSRPNSTPNLPAHLQSASGAGMQDLAGLHLQASEWHEAQGQNEPSIRHALAAKAWSRAAYLIDLQADACLNQGRIGELQAWLEHLPDDTLDAWPRLLIVQAYVDLRAGKFDRAQALVDRAAQRIEKPQSSLPIHLPASEPADGGQDEILGHLDAVRADLALHIGRGELALELSRQAITLLPLERSFWRSLAAGCAGQVLAQVGKHEQASRYFGKARVEAELANNLDLCLRFGIQQLDSLWEMGRPQEAEKVCRELIQLLLEQVGFEKPLAARLYARWARLLAETGQGDEALAVALEALVMAGEDPPSRAEAVLALTRVYLAQGAVEAARRALSDHPAWLEENPFEAAVLRIDIELSRRRPQQAERAFANQGLDMDRTLSDQPAELQRLAARLLLVQGHGMLAVQRLQALHSHESESSSVETLALLALAYQAIDAEQASLDALSQALFLAAPQGWVGPFIRYGREMARLLYRAGTQGIQPDFVIRLLDRMPYD